MNRIQIAALALVLCASGALHGRQDTEKKIVAGDFESDLSGWSGIKLDDTGANPDGESKIAVTKEAKVGKGALSYTYEIAPKTVRVLILQKALDLTGMKSLRLWVKCSQATAVIIGLTETGGAAYQAAAHCPAGGWQEIAVNLDELTVDEPAKDANGKLDLDQVGSITILDIGGFLANFLPDLKGTRTMILDDLTFSSKPVTLTTGATQITKVIPIHLVDNFESPVIRWIPISLEFAEPPKFNLFDAPVTIDKDVPPGGGKGSLKFSYARKGKKFHGIMRMLDKVNLAKAQTVHLSMKCSHDATLIVSIEEKDGSRYNKKVDLLLGDWKTFAWPLSEFTLAEDSQDENGKLDPDQIKQISIADVTTLLGGGGDADQVHLWLDQVSIELAP